MKTSNRRSALASRIIPLMESSCSLILIVFMPVTAALGAPAEISKQVVVSQGNKRSYYLFVPDSVEGPAPLLITLHGSGSDGLSLAERWKDLASREGFIVAGPDSYDSQAWTVPEDGPDFLRDLVEELKTKYPVNSRRVYLFGHSGGAVFALNMSMLESEYFAATAIHAGAWRRRAEFALIDYAKRKIPLAIVVGDQDQFFRLSAVKSTSERLKAKGFEVEIAVLQGHDHRYDDLAREINEQLWRHLKKYELSEEPEYEQYQFQK
jgi:poly(3-hydroxybutyrate) depolymerase